MVRMHAFWHVIERLIILRCHDDEASPESPEVMVMHATMDA